jgi:hypothetical protein
MEVRHWRAEQRYHRTARELLTRLAIGSGVLCGLTVASSGHGTLVVTRGVAVDGNGLVIIAPNDFEVDPTHLTDYHGRPTGEPITTGAVTVSLCHRECGIDQVALPAESCNGEPGCVPGMVREGFTAVVISGETRREGLPEEFCEALHRADATGDGRDLRKLLDRLAPRGCGCGTDCVPLAVVRYTEAGAELDVGVRTVIRSNRELLDLILCLAERLDECCDRPVVQPPRIADLWPGPKADAMVRKVFLDQRRLEIAFDRDLTEQGLNDPDSWLGVWVLRQDGAERLLLKRTPGALLHVAVPTGGDGAAYQVELGQTPVTGPDVVLVMVRATLTGTIRAADADRLPLDADLAATGLTMAQRDSLWAVAPGAADVGLGALRAAAFGVPNPGLPSGDGSAGGDLHLALPAEREVAAPPRLMEVWPAAATILNPNDPAGVEQWKLFMDRPRISIVVSRELAGAAIADPNGWLRAWQGSQEGNSMRQIRQLGLDQGVREPLADGSVRYTFNLFKYEPTGIDPVLVQLRATHPIGAGSPVAADDGLLLDADFTGTSVGKNELYQLWQGDPFPNGLAILPATGSTGTPLYDGFEGEVAHWTFTAIQP